MSVVKKLTKLNGKRNLVLEETEVWFDDNTWSIIKEFAGIYNFDINWKFKMTAHHYQVTKYVNCFSDWTQARYKKTDEAIIRREFWKDLNAGMYINRFSTRRPILPVSVKKECLKCFEEKFNNFKPPKDLLIGDIIKCHTPHYSTEIKIGRVIKKTDKTFTVGLFSTGLCDEKIMNDYSTITRYYIIFQNVIIDNVIIKSNNYSRYKIERKKNENGIDYDYSRMNNYYF